MYIFLEHEQKTNVYFTEVEAQMFLYLVRRCSHSLIIKEMQVKIIIRHHFTLTRLTKNKTENIKH